MDPDANLELALERAREIIRAIDQDEEIAILDEANSLAELVIALDEWITRGGFLPDRWRHSRRGQGD